MNLLWPIILLLLSISTAHAYTTATPDISGYNNRTMKLTGSSGGYSTALGTYARTATVLINGKTVPIPGYLKPLSTLGKIAKSAMRLNPYMIAGTIALTYLSNYGMTQTDGFWNFADSGQATYLWAQYGCGYLPEANFLACVSSKLPGYTWTISPTCTTSTCLIRRNGSDWNTINKKAAVASTRPATDADWDALPDPMTVPEWNALAESLPSAAYLPEGVTIVESPAYIPQTVTVGAPYTKADGSTAQPMAKISPAGDGQVTIDTYEQPLTNPDGTPVPINTPSTDTVDQPEKPKDPCIENPGRLGCMDAGSDTKAVPKSTVDFTFTPEASPISGGCPAPISVLGKTISYQPACDAMGMIRPVVLGMASIMAAFILIGAFKGGD